MDDDREVKKIKGIKCVIKKYLNSMTIKTAY